MYATLRNGGSQFVIYGLHSGDGKYRYIGKTAGGIVRRMYEHKYSARTNPKSACHKWMNKYGHDNIQAEILQVCDNNDELVIWEQVWIESLLPEGFPLLNHTGGGEGQLGIKRSPELLARMSAIRKGLLAGEKHPMWGKHHTTEARVLMGTASRDRWADPEFREKMQAILIEKPRPKGDKHHMAKLTTAQAQHVLDHPEMTLGQHAEGTGVSKDAIWRIRAGRNWKHLTTKPVEE